MYTRRFIINRRNLFIAATLPGHDVGNPVGQLAVVFDLPVRPLFALRCASFWSAPARCGNCVTARASFARFGFESGHFEIIDASRYISPNATDFVEFSDALRREFARVAVKNWRDVCAELTRRSHYVIHIILGAYRSR